jgi:hypothetical protein
VNDLSAWAPWIAVALSAAAFLYSVIKDRSKEDARQFETLEEKLDDKVSELQRTIELKAGKDTVGILHGKLDIVEDRTTRIESDLRHLPDQSTVNKLEGMIGSLSTQVGVLSERIRPVAAIADRLQERILEQAGFER